MSDGPETSPLARTLGLPLLTLYGLGNILGAGIYVLVGAVAGAAGAAAPVAFLVAAVLVAATAYTYGELAARHPVSAGEAAYLQAAFGRPALSTSVGCLIALAGMVSAATILHGFAGYLEVFASVSPWLAKLAVVVSLGALAAWGIRESAQTAALLTLIELAGLVVVVWLGREHVAEAAATIVRGELEPSWAVWPGVVHGAFLAFYAFIGFEDMVNVAEEVVAPARTMRRAIVLALAIATVMYLLVAVVAVAAVAPAELAGSSAALTLVWERLTTSSPVFIGVVGLFAVVNGALIQIVMASRILYGMSRQGWLPAALGRVHPRRRTPIVATVAVSALIFALAIALPVVTLAGATSLLVLVVFTLMHVALLALETREERRTGRWRRAIWVPAVGAGINVVFVVVAMLGATR